jgi:sulfoquinovosyltransferase
LQEELEKNRCRPRSIEVWQRGVDTDVFNPKHKSAAMRARMTDGHPEDPLLVYVGRLGAEKNTEALKDILLQVRRLTCTRGWSLCAALFVAVCRR